MIGGRVVRSGGSALGSHHVQGQRPVCRVVAPHRVQDAGHASRERDDRDPLATPLGDL
jgi:hypothetical protein